VLRALDVATSAFSTVVRGGSGHGVGRTGARPDRLLELYDFEACPHCRKVREMLSVLDLDARIYPCPRGGTRFRLGVRARGGRERFPFLVDPNTGREMYEADEINGYLASAYGDGKVPVLLSLGPLTLVSSGLASISRIARGRRAVPSRAPTQPLELWSFEASPFCRLAREALCELELPYLLHNVAKGSPKRAGFVARSGKMMVPFLADPNTGKEMFESADIVRYLHATYAA
jgi:glutathione S-transferase